MKRIVIPRIRRHADIDEELEEGIESESEEQTENYCPFDDNSRKRREQKSLRHSNGGLYKPHQYIPNLPLRDEDSAEDEDSEEEEEEAELGMDEPAFLNNIAQLPPHLRMLAEGQIPEMRLANLTNEERAVLLRQMFFEREVEDQEMMSGDDLDEENPSKYWGANDDAGSDDSSLDDNGSASDVEEDMQTF